MVAYLKCVDYDKSELFWNNAHVWRKKVCGYNPTNSIPTVKYGGGSINLAGPLHIIKENMIGEMTQDEFEQHLMPSAKKWEKKDIFPNTQQKHSRMVLKKM